MRNKLYKISITTLAVAMAFALSCSSNDDPPYVDKGNDITNYKTIQIGTQKWMGENLDYAIDGSKCYNNKSSNCVKYGRLYDWATAMGLPPHSDCNSNSCSGQIQQKHRGICPIGWHIPSNAEWNTLLKFVDKAKGGEGEENSCATGTCYESYTAGWYLKATSGWNGEGNGSDTYSFFALPGGCHPECRAESEWEDKFCRTPGIRHADDAGNNGSWWSTSEESSKRAYARSMISGMDYIFYQDEDKLGLFSVRCLQD